MLLSVILYNTCNSGFFLHAWYSVLPLSMIVLWYNYMSILLKCFFLLLSFKLSSHLWFPPEEQLAFNHQSTWSTRCRVRGKLTCCLFFLFSLFYEGNFFLIMCAVFLFPVSVTECIEKAKKLDFHPSLQSSQLLIILMFIITKVCWGRYIYTRIVCFLFACLFVFLAGAGRWEFHHKMQFWKVDSCPLNVDLQYYHFMPSN